MSKDKSSERTPTEQQPAAAQAPKRGRSTLDEVDSIPGERATELESRREVEQRRAEIAYLTVIRGQQTGKRFRLGHEAIIGRSAEATIQLSEEEVSRTHARVVRTGGDGYLVEDLGSHNGTRVNGERVKRWQLQVGDRIGLGNVVLLFGRRSTEEEDLLERQKLEAIGRLAGGVAHDFNNLLAVVLGSAHLLREAVMPVPGKENLVRECFQDLLTAAEDAGSLVRQLLDFARSGQREESLLDVTEVLQEIVRLLQRPLGTRIHLLLQASPGLLVTGDRSQLKQMVMNLCLNARDAMPEGGRIRVRAWYDASPSEQRLVDRGPQVRISVTDEGMGMDAETLERIFEPFYTTKQLGRGTGLGLATVHGIVQNHGGRVWAESRPGEGSVFHVSLPASRAQRDGEDIRKTATPDSGSAPSAPGLVLVVDDEAIVRRSLVRIVRSMGYEVVEAQDGAEALERYRERMGVIQAVILDLLMPNMEGDEALVQILRLDPDARVIITSGYHDETQVQHLREAGAVAFLAKPFTALQVQAALNAARKGGLLRS